MEAKTAKLKEVTLDQLEKETKIKILTFAGFFLLNTFAGLAFAANWKFTIVLLIGCLIFGFVYTQPQLCYLFLVFILFSDPRAAEYNSMPFYVLDFGGPSLYIYDVFVFFLAIGLLCRILAKKDPLSVIPGSSLLILLFCFLGVVSIGVAYHNGFPLFDYRWNIKQGRFILYALMFFINFLVIRNKKDLQRLFSVINIAVIFLLVFGSVNLVRYWGVLVRQLVIGRDPSNILTLVFLVSFAVFIFGMDKGKSTRFLKRLPLIAVFVAGALIIASLGRASIFSFLAGFSFLMIVALLGGKPEVLSIFLILLLIVFGFFSITGSLSSRFSPEMVKEAGNVSRLNQWTSSFQIIKEHPVFGLGVGSEYRFFEPASKQDYTMPWGQTHNSFIWILQKMGFISLFVFLAIVYTSLRRGIAIFLSEKDPYLKGLTLGLTSYIFAWLVSAFFQDNLTYSRLSILFWISIALIFIIGNLCEKEPHYLVNQPTEV